MKKGFTLIELLAVIVILAIIALIATPIILGIINDARKESQERSIELYASAAKNAIAKYQLNNTSSPTSFDQLDIEYDGDVVCTTQELYADGSIYLADCTVNGDAVDYTYGTKQVTQIYKSQYYSASSGSIGGDLPIDAKANVSEIDTKGYTFYLRLNADSNNKVSEAYVCFTRSETEYCLKGYDTSAYETNKTVLEEAFKDVENACSVGDDYSFCNADSLNVNASSDGSVSANTDGAPCRIGLDGTFVCEY